jgi:hypothetical protein
MCFRPAALSFAGVTTDHSALPDKKTGSAEPIELVLTGQALDHIYHGER